MQPVAPTVDTAGCLRLLFRAVIPQPNIGGLKKKKNTAGQLPRPPSKIRYKIMKITEIKNEEKEFPLWCSSNKSE